MPGFSDVVCGPWAEMSQCGRITEECSEILRAYMLIPNCCFLGMMAFYCIEQISWLKSLPANSSWCHQNLHRWSQIHWETGQNEQGSLTAGSSRVREVMGCFGDKLWSEQDRTGACQDGLEVCPLNCPGHPKHLHGSEDTEQPNFQQRQQAITKS